MTNRKQRKERVDGRATTRQPRTHLEVLVEEESAAKVIRELLPRVAPQANVVYGVRHFRGKPDLLKNLPRRLEGYAELVRRGEDWRVAVLVDRDNDDCSELKKELDAVAINAGLTPRSRQGKNGGFAVLNRIAVRELESWYFGDWAAVRAGFPKVAKEVPRNYRTNPDQGGNGKTSDAFEKVLTTNGVRIASKPEWGRRIGPHLDPDGNRSPSFRAFVSGVRDLVSQKH